MPLGYFIYNHSFEDTLVIKYEYQNYPSPYPLFLLTTKDHLVIPFKPSLNTPHSYSQLSFTNEGILDKLTQPIPIKETLPQASQMFYTLSLSFDYSFPPISV